jgi:hypothetical protein
VVRVNVIVFVVVADRLVETYDEVVVAEPEVVVAKREVVVVVVVVVMTAVTVSWNVPLLPALLTSPEYVALMLAGATSDAEVDGEKLALQVPAFSVQVLAGAKFPG